MTDFAVSVEHHHEDPRVSVVGMLDRDAERALLAAFAGAADGATSGSRRVVLDLQGMTYMNSSGIANLVLLLQAARERSVTVAVRGLTSHYRHLFEITRLADLVEMEEETT